MNEKIPAFCLTEHFDYLDFTKFYCSDPGDLDHRPGGHEESGGWTIVMGATMCIPQLDRAMPSGVKAQSLQLLHQSIE
jgi:hypothetical protein